MNEHRFEANVEPSGWGSYVKVDGVEVPEVVSFKVKAGFDRASLTIECKNPGTVVGVVQGMTFTGDIYVVSDGNCARAAFESEEDAQRFLQEEDLSDDGVIVEIPLTVKR